MVDVDRNTVKQSRSTWNKVDKTFSVYSKDSSCRYNHPQTVEMPIKKGFVTDQYSLVCRWATQWDLLGKANSSYFNTPTYNVQLLSMLPSKPTPKVTDFHFTEPIDSVNMHSDQSLPNSLEQASETQPMLSMYPTTPPSLPAGSQSRFRKKFQLVAEVNC